jgi:selenocysteine lyase/cysteine desulfurase
MKRRGDKKNDDVRCRPGLHNTRRDFLKLCGVTAGGGAAGLLLPGASEAQDALESLNRLVLQDRNDELFWSLVRRQFVLKPGLIYMNTGTEGSMPRFVILRMQQYLREFAENPWDAITGGDGILSADMTGTRTRMADFVGADPGEILLTHSTTEGLCFAANGLDMPEGSEVLTTLHEYPSGLACWRLLREPRNVTMTQIELPFPAENKEGIVDAFARAITPRTRVMSFCHINFTTGLRMPVKELCRLARDNGIISVVDGAHAIGMLDLNLHDLGCDFYAASPHKWLNAPPGTGVLYIRDGMLENFWPTITETSPPFAPDINVLQGRGQQFTPAFACLNDLIDFQQNTIGKERVESRILALSSYVKDKIRETWGEESLFSPVDEALSSGLTSFNPFADHSDFTKIKVYTRLREKYNIIVRSVGFKNRLSDPKSTAAMRVSTHIFNNYREIDKLIDSLQALIAEM